MLPRTFRPNVGAKANYLAQTVDKSENDAAIQIKRIPDV
jgi:hypothetical protein